MWAPVSHLVPVFSQSCEWDGVGSLVPGAHSARLVWATHLLAGREEGGKLSGLSTFAECFRGQMGKLKRESFAEHPPAASASKHCQDKCTGASQAEVGSPLASATCALHALGQGLCLSKFRILHLYDGGNDSPGGVNERIRLFSPVPGKTLNVQ